MTGAVRHIVQIGGSHVDYAPACIETVLGSCVALVLHWPHTGAFGLAHIVLPQAPVGGDSSRQTRYADTALPALLKAMGVPRRSIHEVRAAVIGGSAMFDVPRVGIKNQRAVTRAVRALGIRIRGRDVGGNYPRRVHVECSTCEVRSTPLPSTDHNPPRPKPWKATL